jgi:hypothetical protein
VPPLFGQFGKKAKDLFKKKYEFDNQAKIIANASNGLNVESSVIAANNAPLRGVFKTTAPVRSLGVLNGTFETEFHTVSHIPSTTSYKFTKLLNGLSVKVGLNAQKPDPKSNPDFQEGWLSAEAEYSQEYVSGSVGVRTNTHKTLVDASVSLGYNDMTVGGKVTFNKDAPGDNKYDINFGAQLDGPDYVVAGVTDRNHSQVTLSYYQAVGKGHVVGASLTSNLTTDKRALTFGTDYALDVDTTVRAYAKVDSGSSAATTAAVAVEHRLLNPQVLVGVAAEFNVNAPSITANKVGVSLTFGDY